MHPPEVKARALALVDEGLNDCQISRRIGIPRRTILDWRRPTYVPSEPAIPRSTCPRCWRSAKPICFTPEDYCELLGLYLGDGCISKSPRTHRLRITLDAKYPKIIDDASALLRRSLPRNSVNVVRSGSKGSCVDISTYCSHLPCLLPQHGAGKKHERRIRLEPWQQELLERAPWCFIRGCIRSDGCAFVNRTDIHRPVPYEYLSYNFSNKSTDIVELFLAACDLVEVEYRATFNPRRGLWQVRVNRRGSVAKMVARVGLKE